MPVDRLVLDRLDSGLRALQESVSPAVMRARMQGLSEQQLVAQVLDHVGCVAPSARHSIVPRRSV